MADRQKPWELHEAVVLLDGLLDIQINQLPRAEVIDRVSHDLRMMAINQGYDIDEVFRNRNGITFQIKSMESAYVGYTVMKPASKLFAETVALYRNFPSEYEKIRKEARAMVDGNNEKKFMSYLASQVSPTLITEFSSYYADIEAFCLRLNILAKSLFDTTDFETIKRVQKTIEQNKIFRITRKRNYEKIVIACHYYYVYVRDGLYRNDESPDVSRESKESSPVVATTHNTNSISKPTDVKNNGVAIGNNSAEIVTAAKHLSLEDMVCEALREETEKNNYGTTVSFLQGQIRGGDRAKIKAILDGAEWAKFQFGRYFYVTPQSPVTEANDCAAVASDSSKTSIERTESDKRLLQKYPIVYKRLFSSLLKLTESHPEGVSVADLYIHINRIGRPAVIEEILDNASWAATDGSNYIFSKEIVDHSVVINDEIDIRTETRADTADMVVENFTEEIGQVDFDGSNDLAYTRPLSFTYFEEETIVSSWTDLYVTFLQHFVKIIPIFLKLVCLFRRTKDESI